MGGQERVALDLAIGQRALGHDVHRGVAGRAARRAAGGGLRGARRSACARVAKRAGFDLTLPVRLAWLFAQRARATSCTRTIRSRSSTARRRPSWRARARCTPSTAPNPDSGTAAAAAARGGAARATRTSRSRDHRRHRAQEPRGARAQAARRFRTGSISARFHPDAEARAHGCAPSCGIPSDAWVVGTVGRLASEKDQALLVRALAPSCRRSAQLVIVGDGAERAALVGARWRRSASARASCTCRARGATCRSCWRRSTCSRFLQDRRPAAGDPRGDGRRAAGGVDRGGRHAAGARRRRSPDSSCRRATRRSSARALRGLPATGAGRKLRPEGPWHALSRYSAERMVPRLPRHLSTGV